MARSASPSEKNAGQGSEGIHKPKAIIAGAVAAIGITFALPKVLEVFSGSAAENMTYIDASLMKPAAPNPDEPASQSTDVLDGSMPPGVPIDPTLEPFPTTPVVDTGPERHVTDTVVEEEPEQATAAKPAVIPTSPDGDLALSMKLRWPQFETGDRIVARVRLTNHSPNLVYLPAAGEPNQGLALVIEDAEGNEVRRVVETAKNDQLPRRIEKLESATEIDLKLTVIAEDETPLAPGTYSCYAEMKSDARLARLGLATWTAPKGPIRSKPVALIVRAKPPAK